MSKKPLKPPRPTCLDCKFLSFTTGYAGYYAGEHEPPSLSCAKQVWALDAYEDDQEQFINYLLTAHQCDKFEARPDP